MKLSDRLLGCANLRFQVYLNMNLNPCVSLSSRIGNVASRLTGLGFRIRDAVSRRMEAISRPKNAASRKKITPPAYCRMAPTVAALSPGKQTYLPASERDLPQKVSHLPTLERDLPQSYYISRVGNAISRKKVTPPVLGTRSPAKKSHLPGQEQYLPGRCQVSANRLVRYLG